MANLEMRADAIYERNFGQKQVSVQNFGDRRFGVRVLKFRNSVPSPLSVDKTGRYASRNNPETPKH